MNVLVLASAGGDAHRRTLAALVENAARHGEVRVLAPDAEGRALRALGVPVESWNPAGLFNVLRSVGALRRAVERHAPDAIHAVGWSAAAVALGVLAPEQAARTLVTVLDPMRRGEMPKQFIEKRLPELLQRAGHATCAYGTLATRLTERFGVAPERVEVLPPGVTAQLPPRSLRPPGRPGPVLGYASRIEADGAWEDAVDALALVARKQPAAQLWFASKGALHNAVRAYARGRGVLGAVRYADDLSPAEFAAGIDLALVPQGRDGLPYALPQALVDGVPVVGTNHGGIADTLGPFETGWLVPVGADGLAAGVEAAWPAIDAAWAGAQAQRDAAARAFDPAGAGARVRELYARVARLDAGEETRVSQGRAMDGR